MSVCVDGYFSVINIPTGAAKLPESYSDKKFVGPIKKAFIAVREGALVIAQAC